MSYLEELRLHYRAVKSRLRTPPVIRRLPRAPVRIVVNVRPPSRPVVAEPAPPPAPRPPRALTQTGRISFRAILFAVGQEFRMAEAEITGKCRQRPVVLSRQVTMWLGRKAGYSFPVIGAKIDRDHTTCLHGFRSIERKMARDPDFEARIERLWADIQDAALRDRIPFPLVSVPAVVADV